LLRELITNELLARIRQDIDAAVQAKLILSTLEDVLMRGHLSGQTPGFDATLAALLNQHRPLAMRRCRARVALNAVLCKTV